MTLIKSASRLSMPAQVATAVEQRIALVYSDWESHPTEIGKIAARLGVLPLLLDMGGFIALAPDGHVVQAAWDAPNVLEAVSTIRARDLALIVGAKRYPELAVLIPKRTVDANLCRDCAGTGIHPIAASGGPAIACACGGLGWIPPDWELT